MYIVVNHDLKMDAGKIVAQCCHIAAGLTRRLEDLPEGGYRTWLQSGEAKIILKATQAQMEAILDKYPRAYHIRDLGLTQVAPNSLTALGFAPMLESERPPELIALKLR
jgi:PTH2 family peptidyl-tRNA hydrolase